jgi:hypothetical protein
MSRGLYDWKAITCRGMEPSGEVSDKYESEDKENGKII